MLDLRDFIQIRKQFKGVRLLDAIFEIFNSNWHAYKKGSFYHSIAMSDKIRIVEQLE